VADITPSDMSTDTVAEQVVTRMAERLTTRQNYFTVVLCAQAVKDVEGITYTDESGESATAAYGGFDVGKNEQYVDPIAAQQRVLAVVYRDALTNSTRVERFDYLNE